MIEVDFNSLSQMTPADFIALGLFLNTVSETRNMREFSFRFAQVDSQEHIDIDVSHRGVVRVEWNIKLGGIQKAFSFFPFVRPLCPPCESWFDWVESNPTHIKFTLMEITQHWFQLKKEVLEEKKETLNR